MTAQPAFSSATTPANAASNAALTLPLPAGNPAGKLLVAVVASRAIGSPAAPTGWSGPVGGDGVWLFTKPGHLSDSGGSVTFAAWSVEVVSVHNSGVVLVYDNAAAFDVVSDTETANGWVSTPPQVRTATDLTAVLQVFTAAPSSAASAHSMVVPATERVDYEPSGTGALWLAVSEQLRSSAGKTSQQTVVLEGGNSKWRSLTAVLRDNVAPYAPTLTAPPDGSAVDLGQPVAFTWRFSDPDPADTQSQFQWRYAPAGTSSWSTILRNTAAQEYDVPASSFTAGDYQWQVRTVDAAGNVGPWTPSRYFTAATPPAAPTVTDPSSGETLTGPDQAVSLTFPNTTRSYEVRVVGDIAGTADPTNLLSDTGSVALSPSFQRVGPTIIVVWPINADVPVTFTGEGTDQHVQARVASVNGLWSAWADVLVHVDFVDPPAPTLNIAAETDTASILTTWTTPAPVGPQPPAIGVDIYISTDDGVTSVRVATGLALNGSWAFWTPASGVDYWFRAVTVAADGATAHSPWIHGDEIPSGDDSLFGAGLFGAGLFGGAGVPVGHSYITAPVFPADGTDQSAAIQAFINGVPNGLDADHRTIVLLPDTTGAKPLVNGQFHLNGRRYVTLQGQSPTNPFTVTTTTSAQQEPTVKFGGGSVGCQFINVRVEGSLTATHVGNGQTYALYNGSFDKDSGFLIGDSTVGCEVIDCSAWRCRGDGISVGQATKPPATDARIIRFHAEQCGRHAIGSVSTVNLYVENLWPDHNGLCAIDCEPNAPEDVCDGMTVIATVPGTRPWSWWTLGLSAQGLNPLNGLVLDGITLGHTGSALEAVHLQAGSRSHDCHIYRLAVDPGFPGAPAPLHLVKVDGTIVFSGNNLGSQTLLAKLQGGCATPTVTSDNTPTAYTST